MSLFLFFININSQFIYFISILILLSNSKISIFFRMLILMNEYPIYVKNSDIIEEIPLNLIDCPEIKLRPLDKDIITNLIQSIKINGMLQPIMVRPKNNRYEIIFGNHRFMACQKLKIRTIKCVVKTCNEDEAFLLSVNENIQRNEFIDPIEEAKIYQNLINKGWKMKDVARAISRSDNYVSDRIKLLRLDLQLAKRIGPPNSNFTTSHAEILSNIDKHEQIHFYRKIIEKRISVRTLESIIKSRKKSFKKQIFDLNLLDISGGKLYNCGERVALITQYSANILLNNFRGDIRRLAKEMAFFTKRTIKKFVNFDIEPSSKTEYVQEYVANWNKRSGMGILQFSNNVLILKNPFFSNKVFWKQYFESFLTVKLKILDSSKTKFRFKILDTNIKNFYNENKKI